MRHDKAPIDYVLRRLHKQSRSRVMFCLKMSPEEEFLKNAAMLLKYTNQELKQFLVWTEERPPYGPQATKLIRQLENAAHDLQELDQAYKKR